MRIRRERAAFDEWRIGSTAEVCGLSASARRCTRTRCCSPGCSRSAPVAPSCLGRCRSRQSQWPPPPGTPRERHAATCRKSTGLPTPRHITDPARITFPLGGGAFLHAPSHDHLHPGQVTPWPTPCMSSRLHLISSTAHGNTIKLALHPFRPNVMSFRLLDLRK